MGLVTLDMSSLDRENIHGKIICNISQFVKAIIRAGLEEISHRNNVSSFLHDHIPTNHIPYK